MKRLLPVGAAAAMLAAGAFSQAPFARAELGLGLPLKKEDPEQAAHHFRRAWLFANNIDNSRDRRQLQGQVAELFRELDRDGLRTVRSEAKALEDLRETADGYIVKGWLDTAERYLRACEELMPDSVKDELRRVETRRAELAAITPETEVARGANDLLREWFEDGELTYDDKDWSFAPDGMHSPPCDGAGPASTQMLLSTRPFEGDGRIRFQVKMGPMGSTGFAFAVRRRPEQPDFHLFSVFYEENSALAVAYRVNGLDVKRIQSENLPFSKELQKGWLEVEILLSNNTAIMRAGPQKKPLIMSLPEGTDGLLGFYVTGDTEYDGSIHYRNLTLEHFAPVQ